LPRQGLWRAEDGCRRARHRLHDAAAREGERLAVRRCRSGRGARGWRAAGPSGCRQDVGDGVRRGGIPSGPAVTAAPAARDIRVAIGIPERFGAELQGWRERLGDPNATRIVPHVTLLPPTPVEPELLPTIEEHLRLVATLFSRFTIRLRGSATF